ncbi:hypothetical protein Hanom_Chr09g00761801 [Helianthus anomalus]
MYARAESFASPPFATEGAHISNLRPCRDITPTRKEVVFFPVKSGNPQGNVAAGARSSGSVCSKDQPSGATPTSIPVKETEVHPIPELTRKNASKRPGEDAKPDYAPGANKVSTGKPAIGKKGSVRTLYTHVSSDCGCCEGC